jgi:hypothetical protein
VQKGKFLSMLHGITDFFMKISIESIDAIQPKAYHTQPHSPRISKKKGFEEKL